MRGLDQFKKLTIKKLIRQSIAHLFSAMIILIIAMEQITKFL